jgi:uncharacterized membrane protein YbhN (UPF0104 family)
MISVIVGFWALANIHRLGLLRKMGWIATFLRDLSVNAAQLIRQPAKAFQAFGLSLMVHAAVVYLSFLIANALGAPLTFLDAFLILPTVLFISSLPISIAGWGVREAGLAGGFLLLGLPGDAAVATSILIGLISMIGGLPGAVLFLFEENRGQLSASSAS